MIYINHDILVTISDTVIYLKSMNLKKNLVFFNKKLAFCNSV